MRLEQRPLRSEPASQQASQSATLQPARTRPYTPRTNGKAERFIQTALREWAYAAFIRTQTNAASSCAPGCTSTTGIVRMVVSARRHPSADQLSIGTTCWDSTP